MNEPKKTLVLFPKDNSTTFLEDVISHVLQNVHGDFFAFVRIEPSDESHRFAISEIRKKAYDTILFLGHGTMSTLHGAQNDSYKNDKFITANAFSVFADKKLILVSCASSTLLKRQKEPSFVEGIGFGDLPTDWNDIQCAREYDVKAYKGFTEHSIEAFRKELVDIIKYSVVDYMNDKMDLIDLYSLFLLRINKRISKLFLKNESENEPVSEALFRMKHEIIHIKPFFF